MFTKKYRNTALTATKQEIQNSEGSIYGWSIINPNTVDVFVKFYDGKVNDVTVGVTTPSLVLLIPAGITGQSGLFFQEANTRPIETFLNGITVAAVTGLADNSTAAPATAIFVDAVRYA